jgi:hypothetical protein
LKLHRKILFIHYSSNNDTKGVTIMKALKSKIQHKHAREGAQHSAGETKINAIIAQIQNIRCLFCSHIWKGQRGPPRQKEGT